MRRGQSAVEFVVLVSFMLIVFFGFFIIIQGRIIELTHAHDLLFLKEANNIVVSEIDLALAAAPDFQHSFTGFPFNFRRLNIFHAVKIPEVNLPYPFFVFIPTVFN